MAVSLGGSWLIFEMVGRWVERAVEDRFLLARSARGAEEEGLLSVEPEDDPHNLGA